MGKEEQGPQGGEASTAEGHQIHLKVPAASRGWLVQVKTVSDEELDTQ